MENTLLRECNNSSIALAIYNFAFTGLTLMKVINYIDNDKIVSLYMAAGPLSGFYIVISLLLAINLHPMNVQCSS